MGKKKRKKRMEQEVSGIQAASPAVRDDVPGRVVGAFAVGRADRWKFVGICLLVFIASFIVYANTLAGDFIWDDEYLILNNSQIKSFTHVANVFRTYVGYGSENINNFYRPVQELSNMLDYFLWGEYPFGFHLTNVLLQSLVAMLVFIFLFYVAGDMMAAGIAALFYAVHPVHTEAVAYIAGRADPLYAIFLLLSLIFFVKYARTVKENRKGLALYAFSIVLFMLSILSKEIVMSMPLLVFCYLFFILRRTENNGVYNRMKWSWAPYAVIVVFYGYLRSTVLSFADIAPQSIFVKIPLVYRLLTFFRSVLVYFRLMVVPVDLHMERAIPITRSVLDPGSIFAFLVVALVAWCAWTMYRKNRLVSFGIAWFFANLLPVSNIVPINSFLAEHWIYMASVGLFLLAGLAAAWFYRKVLPDRRAPRAVFFTVIAGILAVYGSMTVSRNADWKDEITFFNSTLKYHPKNARLHINLGNTYYEKKQIDKAIEQYRKAIDINSGYAVAYGNIGSAYLHKDDMEEAEKYLEKAINLKNNYPIAHYNLGIVYYQRHKYEEAVKELQTAIEQLPQLYQAWNMLGRTYLRLKKIPEAREAFERSLQILPKQPGIQDMLRKLM